MELEKNFEEFTAWIEQENREVDYACRTRNKYPDGFVLTILEFISLAKKRSVRPKRSNYLKHVGKYQERNKYPSYK